MTLVVLILAVYYLTEVLTNQDGPLGVFIRLRNKLVALRCFVCTSIYAALLVYIAYRALEPAVWVLAAAGGAVIVSRVVER